MKSILLWFTKFSVVFFLALLFWALSASKTIEHRFLPFLIICGALLKVSYLLYTIYKKILESVRNNLAFHQFLLFILSNMFLAIVSFAADFWNSYYINPASFEGIDANFTTFEAIFECFYFSSLTFSYFGYGEILPNVISTKLLVMLEVGLSFLNMIFVLADFVGLRESLKGYVKE